MKKLLVLLSAVILFAACGAQAKNAQPAAEESASRADKSTAVSSGENRPGAPTADLAAALPNRMRVKTGTMSMIVSNIKSAEESASLAATTYAGYVAVSRIYADSGNLTLKIPQERFDAFVADMEKLGHLKHKEVAAEDVTDRFFDLETKRILLDRYQDYLKRAVNTKELLDLEQAVNGVTADIESLEGSFRSLKDSIAYSTLDLNLELAPEEKSGLETPSLGAGLRAAGDFSVNFLYYLFLVILYSIIIAVPLLLLGGLVYFVGFGRIGLILKFFRALGAKKK
jgi:hypothetical protein